MRKFSQNKRRTCDHLDSKRIALYPISYEIKKWPLIVTFLIDPQTQSIPFLDFFFQKAIKNAQFHVIRMLYLHLKEFNFWFKRFPTCPTSVYLGEIRQHMPLVRNFLHIGLFKFFLKIKSAKAFNINKKNIKFIIENVYLINIRITLEYF